MYATIKAFSSFCKIQKYELGYGALKSWQLFWHILKTAGYHMLGLLQHLIQSHRVPNRTLLKEKSDAILTALAVPTYVTHTFVLNT